MMEGLGDNIEQNILRVEEFNIKIISTLIYEGGREEI
jgi:hypothetical protein